MLKYSFVQYQVKNLAAEVLAECLSKREKLFFLDSANAYLPELNAPENEHLRSKSRFSYIGINPIREFSYTEDGREPREVLVGLDNFLSDCRAVSYGANYSSISGELADHLKPQYYFFASYNFGERLQGIPNPKPDLKNFPDIYCVLCADNWLYDHWTGDAYYLHLSERELSEEKLERRMQSLIALEGEENPSGSSIMPEVSENLADQSSNFSFAEYIETIDKIKKYIYNGHIYQVNLSQIFSFDLPQDYWATYRKIRKSNAAPFCAYFNLGRRAILSTSPERFLFRSHGKVYTEPIKGTRPRGKNSAEDAKNQEKLLSSIKERSENIMIVDLLRNDLGRICQYGTVKAEKLLYVERYPSVFQLISRIVGDIKPKLSFGNILQETFPGGSITGCPKIRAMEIIAEMEPHRRSVYTGSIGRLAIDLEDFDLSIVIRTIVVEEGQAQMSLGGGIVFDSQRNKEYQETLDKGAAIVSGLRSKEVS